MHTKIRKYLEARRSGHLKIVAETERLLEVESTAQMRKRCVKLEQQMKVVKAWAKGRGLVLPIE